MVRCLAERLRQAVPGIQVTGNELLADHTSFRVGGRAEVMAFPQSVGQLRDLLLFTGRESIPTALLGAGTNVLAPDEGVEGLVICTKNCLCGIRQNSSTEIEAQCGVTMARLATFACQLGLDGLTFAHGIPGTVGGGVYMNAGAYGGEIAQVAKCTTMMYYDGSTQTFTGDEQGFSYRHSRFADGDGIVLSTVFSLTPADPLWIKARMAELAEKRRASQPLEYPSAGSTFKRPAQGYAAALIDQAGLKGVSFGGAAVSEKHAGFVINKGGATAADIRQLMAYIRQKVEEATGILLEPEVCQLQTEVRSCGH